MLFKVKVAIALLKKKTNNIISLLFISIPFPLSHGDDILQLIYFVEIVSLF